MAGESDMSMHPRNFSPYLYFTAEKICTFKAEISGSYLMYTFSDDFSLIQSAMVPWTFIVHHSFKGSLLLIHRFMEPLDAVISRASTGIKSERRKEKNKSCFFKSHLEIDGTVKF